MEVAMLSSKDAIVGKKVKVIMGYYNGRIGVIENADRSGVLVSLLDDAHNLDDDVKGTRINFGKLELELNE
jgi:hypothetical protein